MFASQSHKEQMVHKDRRRCSIEQISLIVEWGVWMLTGKFYVNATHGPSGSTLATMSRSDLQRTVTEEMK